MMTGSYGAWVSAWFITCRVRSSAAKRVRIAAGVSTSRLAVSFCARYAVAF